MPPYAVHLLGCSAVQLACPPPATLAVQERIWALSDAMEGMAGVQETIPGMNNLTVLFDHAAVHPRAVLEAMETHWREGGVRANTPRTITIPTRYGGADALDLDDLSSALGLSAREIVELHCASAYQVYCIGAHAGFGYLGGLDPRLHSPRLASPRLRIPAGSVAIGGTQAGVIAQDSPSGWRVLGRTDVRFFDAQAVPPALLAPGDIVRFEPVGPLP
jgi:5-oxoprolinase (ATP-hydrolysing) subunit B